MNSVRCAALAAAVDALLERGELDHARVFVGELRELLGHRDVKPENIPLVETPVSMPALTLTSPQELPAPTTGTKASTLRMRRMRARQREAAMELVARDTKQLELVTDVTLEPVTSVTERHTESVTGDVTSPLSLSVSSPKRPSKGLLGEEENSLSEKRDGVTSPPVTPTAEPDGACVSIFETELARRPGVTLELAALWRKFQRHGYTFVSGSELRFKWRDWCRREWPERKALPVPPPPPKNEKPTRGESETPPATSPVRETHPDHGPHSVFDEERSRRHERELIERRAREEAARRAALRAAWAGQQLPDPFTPEALEAARRAS